MIVAIVFVATLVRSLVGFGEALVAVPLLAFVLPVETAAPLATLVSITVACVFLLLDWQHVQFRSAALLLAPTFMGIPVGLWLLTNADEAIVKNVLAVLIAAFSVYSLSGTGMWTAIGERTAPLFGFAAGIMGGGYGMNGPPIVVYGTLRKWRPQEFHATLQGYFLPASTVGMAGYWMVGLWTPAVNGHYFASLPAIALAIFAGRMLHRRLDAQRFTTLVHLALIVAAVMLVSRSR
ncbi:MAG: sulfite exporter TauE/SafE family protein [Acidobacteria bacterium]|nr:MAG: sulfite exporter TauE/SafE family protein [Acidobacteriota bacterium]